MCVCALQPAKLYNTVSMSRDFRRVAKTIKKETANYRPDLQKGAPVPPAHTPPRQW